MGTTQALLPLAAVAPAAMVARAAQGTVPRGRTPSLTTTTSLLGARTSRLHYSLSHAFLVSAAEVARLLLPSCRLTTLNVPCGRLMLSSGPVVSLPVCRIFGSRSIDASDETLAADLAVIFNGLKNSEPGMSSNRGSSLSSSAAGLGSAGAGAGGTGAVGGTRYISETCRSESSGSDHSSDHPALSGLGLELHSGVLTSSLQLLLSRGLKTTVVSLEMAQCVLPLTGAPLSLRSLLSPSSLSLPAEPSLPLLPSAPSCTLPQGSPNPPRLGRLRP